MSKSERLRERDASLLEEAADYMDVIAGAADTEYAVWERSAIARRLREIARLIREQCVDSLPDA